MCELKNLRSRLSWTSSSVLGPLQWSVMTILPPFTNLMSDPWRAWRVPYTCVKKKKNQIWKPEEKRSRENTYSNVKCGAIDYKSGISLNVTTNMEVRLNQQIVGE